MEHAGHVRHGNSVPRVLQGEVWGAAWVLHGVGWGVGTAWCGVGYWFQKGAVPGAGCKRVLGSGFKKGGGRWTGEGGRRGVGGGVGAAGQVAVAVAARGAGSCPGVLRLKKGEGQQMFHRASRKLGP